MNTVFCTCCDSELIAPTVIDGKPYGYTCASKIEGGKDARRFKYVPVEILKEHIKNGHRFAVTVDLDGEEKRVMCNNLGEVAFSYVQEDQLFIRLKR